MAKYIAAALAATQGSSGRLEHRSGVRLRSPVLRHVNAEANRHCDPGVGIPRTDSPTAGVAGVERPTESRIGGLSGYLKANSTSLTPCSTQN